MINPDHLAMLAASGITADYAAKRGYETITQKGRLAQIKIVQAARGQVPGLLVPLLRVDGSTWGWQYRPDVPRICHGKPVKYETPWGQENHLDVPPGVGPMLGDPTIPLLITEGSKKADCGVLHGLCVVALPGVWNFRGTNNLGGKVAIADWQDVALNNGRRVILGYDGDLARKESVQKAAHTLGAYLAHKGAHIEYLWLPDTPDKTGLDDYLMGGHTVADLWSLVKPTQPPVNTKPPQPATPPQPKPPPAQPMSIEDARKVFHRWLGKDYDTDALDAELAVAAVEKFDDGSDPVWLLIISGPGAAKTETVQALDGVGAVVTSSISGEAALLSCHAETRPLRQRHRRTAPQDRRPRSARHQGRHVDPVDEQGRPRQGALRAARNLRRPLVSRSRNRGRTHPRMAGPPRRRSVPSPPRGTPRTPSSPRWATGSSWSVSTPPRPEWSPAAKRSPTPATRWRCAPSWPRRWPVSSPA